VSDTTTRKEVIPTGGLMPKDRNVNANSLFAQIVEEGQTWLRYWIGQRMSSLLDKAVDDLAGSRAQRAPCANGLPH